MLFSSEGANAIVPFSLGVSDSPLTDGVFVFKDFNISKFKNFETPKNPPKKKVAPITIAIPTITARYFNFIKEEVVALNYCECLNISRFKNFEISGC